MWDLDQGSDNFRMVRVDCPHKRSLVDAVSDITVNVRMAQQQIQNF